MEAIKLGGENRTVRWQRRTNSAMQIAPKRTILGVVTVALTALTAATDPSTAAGIPPCPSGDEVKHYGYAEIPWWMSQRKVGLYPDVPGKFRLKGFSIADPKSGLLYATMTFNNIDTFKNLGYPNAPAWCNAKGDQSFRISIYAICLVRQDEHFNYIHAIAKSESDECKSNTRSANCRLIKISKPGGGTQGVWTESQDAETGGNGTVQMLYAGDSVRMKLRWSECPTEFKSISVNATFDAQSIPSPAPPSSLSNDDDTMIKETWYLVLSALIVVILIACCSCYIVYQMSKRQPQHEPQSLPTASVEAPPQMHNAAAGFEVNTTQQTVTTPHRHSGGEYGALLGETGVTARLV